MTQHRLAPERRNPAAAEPPDAAGLSCEETGGPMDKVMDTLETMLDAGILDLATGGISTVKLLAQRQWNVGDGPQRMTEAEAEAVLVFGHYILVGRKVWPTDPVGAAIAFARLEHHWAPVAEPGKYDDDDDEEHPIYDEVLHYLANWVEPQG
jgi:hypothetical protein